MEMSQGTAMAMTSSSPVTIGIVILAVVIGLVAITLVIRLNRQLGGKIRSALWYFLLGIFVNLFAMVYTLFFGHVYAIGKLSVDVHDLFMALGMVFFILSAYQFSRLIQTQP